MEPEVIAEVINKMVDEMPVKNSPAVHAFCRDYTKVLKTASPEFMLELALILIQQYRRRGIAHELIARHKTAFKNLGEVELEELGQGINSWFSVDDFARLLSGPAWLAGQISNDTIIKWAHSEDLWWRRAALVSTVALNVRSYGGTGDVERTFMICRLLVDDHEDMIVKAMSWALRELVVHDHRAVWQFLNDNNEVLAARVKREVKHKLTTGLKYPRR
jgi:3-methyladenine DNA glycosylase AlkD